MASSVHAWTWALQLSLGSYSSFFQFASRDLSFYAPSYNHTHFFTKEMAPDLRRKVDAARSARLAREAEMKKLASAQVSQKNTGDSTPPDQ